MKRLLLISLFSTMLFTSLQAQIDRTTYPVDSCLYFMDPYGLRIQNTFQVGMNGIGVIALFQSTSNPNLIITGRGRFVVDMDSLPQGVTLNSNDVGNLLLSVPPPPDNFENWPGGQPPFPLIVYGFLQGVESATIDPPIPISVQVGQLFFEDTSQ